MGTGRKMRVCILGQVWCLIVSIPDLCPLSYFEESSAIICVVWIEKRSK